jgi:hypothetical protein
MEHVSGIVCGTFQSPYINQKIKIPLFRSQASTPYDPVFTLILLPYKEDERAKPGNLVAKCCSSSLHLSLSHPLQNFLFALTLLLSFRTLSRSNSTAHKAQNQTWSLQMWTYRPTAETAESKESCWWSAGNIKTLNWTKTFSKFFITFSFLPL